MAITKSEVSKDMDLTTLKIPAWLDSDEREELLGELGEYFLSEVLDYVGEGVSPVTGKPFKELSSEYAKKEKGGKRLPNLDLNGDMMGAVEYQIEADRLKIGIFDDEQAIKAFGHITGFKGHPWLDGVAPKRDFIPDEKQLFEPKIMQRARELVLDFIEDIKDQRADEELG